METPSDHTPAEVPQKSTTLFGRMFGSDLDNTTEDNMDATGGYSNAALSCIDEADSLSRDTQQDS